MLQKTQIILAAITVAAAAALRQYRFVSFAGGLPAGTNNAAGAALGVANADYALGDSAGVSTHGVLIVESGGAFGVGDLLASDSQGRAILWDATGSGPAFGRAVSAATAAGQLATVLR